VPKKLVALLGLLLIITGCASISTGSLDTNCRVKFAECVEPPTEIVLPTHEQLLKLPPPAGERPIVAVYTFLDLTGQRKSREGIADFSAAVTQGGEALLIDALKASGGGTWFRVVERKGLDHLVRERQLVRSTREAAGEPNIVAPMLFAGIILEGGIIGYDTNVETGGRGARTLGVGASQVYRRDVVVVSLRAVSTLTGEVLMNVQTSKTILSVGGGFDVFKFFDMDTQLVELEDGVTENESTTYAVRAAIEAAVLAIIKQGDERGYWQIGEVPNTEEEETNE